MTDERKRLEEAIEEVRQESRKHLHRYSDDELLMEALERVLGDEVHTDLRYYGAWARHQKQGLEKLLDSEFGVDFGADLTMVVGAFTDLSKNEVEPTLPKTAEVLAALERIMAKIRGTKEAFARRLAPLEAPSYAGCRGLIEAIQENFGDPEKGDG